MADLPTIYAIDFGTSNSLLAAANRERTFDPIPLDAAASDPTILRSILCYPNEGGEHVGAEALRRYIEVNGEARLLRSIKHHLGSRAFTGTSIRGAFKGAHSLAATLLGQMRLRADAHFGVGVRRALIGRPVHFHGDDDAFAEGRLEKAALEAGFEEVHFFPEPVAAARSFGAASRREGLALICDFGGGTSDFTVLRLGGTPTGRDDVLAVGGVAVAGDALDGAIMRAQVAKHFGAEVRYRAPMGSNVLTMPGGVVSQLCSPARLSILLRPDLAQFLSNVRQWSVSREDQRRLDQLTVLVEETRGFHLFEAIERSKRELSSAEASVVRFSHPGIEVVEPVSRRAFEEASERDLAAILRCLDDTVRKAGVGPGEIDVVCCTGGTARVPRLAAELQGRFPGAKVERFKGFHAVVEGLARQARSLEDVLSTRA